MIVFATGEGDAWTVRLVTASAAGPGPETMVGATVRSFHLFDAVATAVVSVRDHDSKSDITYRNLDTVNVVSLGVASQESPAGAFGGGAWLVTWSERRGELWEIRAQRFAMYGQPVGPPLAIPSSTEDQQDPSIEFNGDTFLLTWTERRRGIRGDTP